MKKNGILFILFYLMPLHAFSQDKPYVDSLTRELAICRTDTQKVNILVELSREFLRSQIMIDSVVVYGEKSLALSRKIKFQSGISKSYRVLGRAFFDRSDFRQAISAFKKALESNKVLKSKIRVLDEYLNIARCYVAQGTPEQAIESYYEAVVYFKSTGDEKEMAECLVRIGNIYKDNNENVQAMQKYLAALKIAQQLKDTSFLASTLSAVGSQYGKQQNIHEAMKYFNKSILLFEQAKNVEGLRITYNRVGYMYQENNEFDKALLYHQKCLDLSRKLGDYSWVRGCLGNMGNISRMKGDPRQAVHFHNQALKIAKEWFNSVDWSYECLARDYFALGKYSLAKNYFDSAFINKRLDNTELELLAARIDSASGNKAGAYEHYKKHIAIRDRLRSEEVMKAAAGEKKQAEFERQKMLDKTEQDKKDFLAEEKIRSQLIIRNSFIVGFVLVLILTLVILKNYKRKQKDNHIILQQKIDLEKSFQSLEIIGKIGTQITSSLQLEDVLNNLYGYINSVMDASGFTVYLYNPETDYLETRHKIGKYMDTSRDRVPALSDTSFSALVFQTGKEIWLNDFLNEYTKFNESITEYYRSKYIDHQPEEEIMQAFINVPLFLEDKTVGNINVYSFKKYAYSKTHVEILKSLASYVAIALSNADSFKKLERANENIRMQKNLIEEKHKEITDSINYAERIQRSFMATKELLDENLKDYFVFFRPKDVVSGDFYWASELSNGHFALVTADSTGHGVPGAIMSLLNISALEKSIEIEKSPAAILNSTRKTIIDRLKKDGSSEGGKDGMDCSLISFDYKSGSLTYAAANNPIWILRESELKEYRSDKMPVGKHDKECISFTQHSVELKKGDVVYAFTDGMPDQFGGPRSKKFMYKQLKDLLISIAHEPMEIQKQKISDAFDNWKGGLEQVDDVCLIGVKI